MREERRDDTKEKLIQAIQTDPHLATLIWDINFIGIRNVTDNGTLIVVYHNEETQIEVVIDPAKTNITIINGKTGETFSIHPKKALKYTKEAFGIPRILEIPKFGTNIPKVQEFLYRIAQKEALKNVPSTHQKQHPTDHPES